MDYRSGMSPYCSNYKIPVQHKGLIMQHLIVRKLTRRELEDKYLRLIDENYDLKRENNVQKEKIKVLTTKLLRLTKENSRYKSREFLFMDENNEIQEAEEFFRPRNNRPVSSSAIARKSSEDNMRNSTPNLASKFKSEFSMQDNLNNIVDHSNNNHIRGVKNVDSNRIKEMQEEIERLTDELKRLHEINELEKQTNTQLEIQINELKEKLNCKKIQMELEMNVEIAELNKIIKELELKLRDTESCFERKIEESKLENDRLNETLEREKDRMQKYEAIKYEHESSQKMIEELMQQISTLEKEKSEIVNQYEKYAKITDEVMSYKKQMNEISLTLVARESELEQEKNDRASIEHSQEELLKKMKDLQKENDELVVRLEGLKSENDSLITKNRKLEDRIKNLEDQNKLQLQQVNETLSMPTPIVRNSETTSEVASELVEKIHEIRHQIIKQKTLESKSPSNLSIHLSTSPPNLTIPSVIINNEKRPATPEKDLKVIPKIVEPSTSVADYESTINSNDPPTIPNDSPNRKAFAEMFSQSVSKDTRSIDADDDFDPKTFSIDQKINLRKTQFIKDKSFETSVERAKDILLSDISSVPSKSDKTFHTMKHVRLSLDAKVYPIHNISAIQSRHSVKDNQRNQQINFDSDTESLADYVERISSTRSSASSSRAKFNKFNLPQYLLEHIDDEKMIIKHTSHSIDIEIVKLEMCENSSLLTDDDANFLYVEYSFLSHRGYLLETQSLPKPKKAGESIFYHLNRKFEVNPSKDDADYKILKSMIDKNSKVPLKFLIVSEPISVEKNEEDEGNCEEIGFAVIKLNEVIQKSKSDSETIKTECFSTTYPHEIIAYLYVKISSLDILKKLSK